MSRNDFRRRQARKKIQKFKRLSRHLPTMLAMLVLTALLGGGIFGLYRFVRSRKPGPSQTTIAEASSQEAAPGKTDASGSPSSGSPDSQEPLDEIDRLISQADFIAAGYDYDRAAEVLTSSGQDTADPRIAEAMSRYEAEKAALVPADVKNVPHVFFHSLIMDTAKAFDGDSDAGGYNSVMTTRDEFMKILEEMHKRGYVLVRLHDIAGETTDESGNPVFSWNTIMLPEGKKPFVMSQDDVCYYPYMDGDGFASRLVIGEDGKPTCEMKMEDGSVSTGSYDLIPLLEDFIQEHPDFSYKGARAIIALTGYEGIFGYRTSSAYADSPTYEADRQQAAAIAQNLKDNGWELASHSWGHLQLGLAANPQEGFAISDQRFTTDTDKWEAEVESLIGPTDILLYPYGNDVADWHPYSADNPRFSYLFSKGFRYFCNVDASKTSWMQKGNDHLRMARINLDGYRIYEDMIQADPAKKKLSEFFDAEAVFDPSRPTPVTWDYQKSQDEAMAAQESPEAAAPSDAS